MHRDAETSGKRASGLNPKASRSRGYLGRGAQPLKPAAPALFPRSYVSDILTYRREDPTPHDDFATAVDYSVLRLFDEIGSQAAYFGVTSFDGNWAHDGVWADVSYPAGAGPYFIQDVDISGDHSPGLFGGAGLDLNADIGMYPGCSGSGYWAWFDTGNGQQTPRITGVVSAISDDDTETYLGSGEELVNLVNQARAMWPYFAEEGSADAQWDRLWRCNRH